MKTLEFSKQPGCMICQLEDEYYKITPLLKSDGSYRYTLRHGKGVYEDISDGPRRSDDPSECESIGNRNNGYDSEDKAVAAANDYHSRYSKRKEGA